jgi:hypothetical protein
VVSCEHRLTATTTNATSPAARCSNGG